MSDTVAPTSSSPALEEGARTECDQNSARLFNKAKFSDLLIKFSDREIHAHRFVLCQSSAYFDKLCGPDSHFAEADRNEITLYDDDPDALEAMLRHIYNFWLRPPCLSLGTSAKVRFYCNVVVVSDKYALPALGDEARKSLNTFVVSLEDPEAVVNSLKIITEDYGDHNALDNCAVNLANPRLKDLAAVADFAGWLVFQPQFLQGIVEDAAKLRSLTSPPSSRFKPVPKYKCHKSSCTRITLGFNAKCHGQPTLQDGVVYSEKT
ncbi:hypothetical protein MBLNU13_g04358t3 [Cladosporium sp. NU13]